MIEVKLQEIADNIELLNDFAKQKKEMYKHREK